MQPISLLAELYDIDLPGSKGLVILGISAQQPDSIYLEAENYAPGVCGASAIDDVLCSAMQSQRRPSNALGQPFCGKAIQHACTGVIAGE